jgi:hypothetical protein
MPTAKPLNAAKFEERMLHTYGIDIYPTRLDLPDLHIQLPGIARTARARPQPENIEQTGPEGPDGAV